MSELHNKVSEIAQNEDKKKSDNNQMTILVAIMQYYHELIEKKSQPNHTQDPM